MSPLTRRDALRRVAGILTVGLAGCSMGATDDRCGEEPPPTDSTIPTEPVGAAPSLSADASWPMYRHDAGQTGFVREPRPADGVRLAWSASIGDGQGVTRPIVTDGTIVFSDNSVLAAVSPTDGSVEWSVADLRGPTPPAILDGLTVVGDRTGLYAFDLESGTKQWNFTPDVGRTTTPPTPTAPPDRSSSETASAGTEAGSGSPAGPPGPSAIDSAPLVADDTIVVEASDRVYAIASDGSRRWDRDGYLGAISGGTVYLVGQFGLRAVAVASGERRSTRDTGEVTATMAIRDGTVYSGGLQTVSAVDAETGETQWTFEGEHEEFATPAVTGDTVFAASSAAESGDGGNLYALDRTSGELRWCQYLGWGALDPPAVTADTVYVGVPVENETGTVEARAVDDGRLRWRYRPAADGITFREPAVAGGLLVAGTEHGTVYAFAEQ